jgi:uncharacterized repeat protein (TIGR03843 family)
MSCDAATLDLLARGAIAVKGRMPWSSNITLLAEVSRDGAAVLAVYKPLRGERPLWDFPRGLYRREVAAYRLSEVLGWGLVPPTIARDDAPHGEGSLQLFVEADFEQHYLTLSERAEHREQFQRICLFDLVTNNADRKSGHCLLAADGRVWAIDNGLMFHAEPKLRTVIWEFAGEAIPRPLVADLRRLADGGVPAPVAELIAPGEREALLARARALVRRRTFPKDESGARYPWPPV